MHRRKKKLFVKTYGCQMNVYDSERMAEVLAPQGYAADRTRPRTPTWSSSTPATSARRRRRRSIPSSAGCAPLKAGEARAARSAWPAASPRPRARRSCARAPVVDLVVGPQTYHRLPEMVARRAAPASALVETEFPAEDKFDHLPRGRAPRRGRRGLPDRAGGLRQVLRLLRGALYPRRRGLAARRARAGRGARLVARGVREITLLGQNVNAYPRRRTGWPWRRWCARWRGSPASSASATPPAIRTTWTTT